MEEFDKSSLYYVDSTPEGTRYSLYDTASWKNGLAFKNIDFSETGLPVIKIAELNNGISSSTAYTDKTYSQDVFLTKGDYVFSWSGNPETSIDIYKYNLSDGWLNQHIFKVTPKTEIIDKEFFFYLMKFLKPYFKKIATNKQTTGLGHVTISDLQRMSVTLPPLPIQQKIAVILSSLDDKIELNNKINTNLEQQAQALFKNWFVDFAPFGGKMPEGWKEVEFRDVCENITDGVHNTVVDDLNGDYLLLSCKNIKGGVLTISSSERKINKETFEKLRKRTKLAKGDILLSSVGTVGEMYLLNETPDNYEFQRSVAIIKPNTSLISPAFLYESMLLQKDTIIHSAHGAVQQCIFISDVGDFKTILPTLDVIDKFTNIIQPMLDTITANQHENQKLANIRDTLLPKLMNGEINLEFFQI